MDPPKLKRDWPGHTVRTRRDLANGHMIIPAGTVCEVTGYYRGVELKAAPCEHCGVRLLITRVPERDVEVIGKAKK